MTDTAALSKSVCQIHPVF